MKTYKRNPGQDRIRSLFTSGKRFNLVYGGSRSGKTFEIVGTIIERALLAPGSRHLIVRQEASSAKRAIAKGTIPEVIALRWPGLGVKWREQYGYFELENGSEIWVGGLNDDKALEKILGNEYATIYINEASEVRYSAFTLLRSRLAQTCETISGKALSQRFYIDLNPTTVQHWTYRIWIDNEDPETGEPIDGAQYGFCVVNPDDNRENLSAEYLADLDALPERSRRRFRDGEYSADDDNALWRRKYIKTDDVPELARIVVAVDPAVTNQPGSDETGIIVTGVCKAGRGYVLADESGKFRPEEWARRAISAYDTYDADCIVAETNQGGDMVESTVRAQSPGRVIPVRKVTATRGKHVRAEPVAALYELGKIRHKEHFPQLEDQMCSFTQDLDRKKAGFSPDRVDALVWGFSDLFCLITRKKPQEAPRESAPIAMPMAGRW